MSSQEDAYHPLIIAASGAEQLEQCQRLSVRTFTLLPPYLAWRRIVMPSWPACDDRSRALYGRRPTPATSWPTSRPTPTIPPTWPASACLGRPHSRPQCSHAVVSMRAQAMSDATCVGHCGIVATWKRAALRLRRAMPCCRTAAVWSRTARASVAGVLWTCFVKGQGEGSPWGRTLVGIHR